MQLNRGELNEQARTAAANLSESANATSLTLDSSLSFVTNNFYTSDDSIYLEQPEQNSPLCTSNYLSAGAGGQFVCSINSVSCSTAGSEMTTQLTSPLFSRQLAPSLTAITLHSTPISTPVKTPFYAEISSEGDHNNYLSLSSTGSPVSSLVLNSEFHSLDESSSSSSLFL